MLQYNSVSEKDISTKIRWYNELADAYHNRVSYNRYNGEGEDYQMGEFLTAIAAYERYLSESITEDISNFFNEEDAILRNSLEIPENDDISQFSYLKANIV